MAPSLHESLLISLRVVLRPVVGFCLRRAIKFQEFSEIARNLFIDEARKELTYQSVQESTSKLSVMTGLQRREIDKRLRAAGEAPQEENLITRVVGQWLGDKRFLDSKGKPRDLTTEGLRSEFASLVSVVSRDLNYHTVLFELERLGMARRDAGSVSLLVNAYVPHADPVEGFSLLSSDAADLINAVEDNVLRAAKPPHLHAKTTYDNIDPSRISEIREWLLEFGGRIHAEVRSYLASFDKDINPEAKGGDARVSFGTFSVAEEIKPPKSSSTGRKARGGRGGKR